MSGIGLAVTFGSPRQIQIDASADKINVINAHVLTDGYLHRLRQAYRKAQSVREQSAYSARVWGLASGVWGCELLVRGRIP